MSFQNEKASTGWGVEHSWLPSVAVSLCVGDNTWYERPTLTSNDVGGLAEFSADGIQFGFSVFEGMRAYVATHTFLVFRAHDHYKRLKNSCTALALPCPAFDVFIEAIEQAVRANWDGCVTRLYLRPVVFAAGGDIMPQQIRKYVFAVLVKGFDLALESLSVLVEQSMPRTIPMFASVKTAGNYTSAALATQNAREAGYDTILWVDGDGHLQECTTMNVFLCLGGQLVTPKLGSILPGVTRRTVLDLLAAMGERVVQRDVCISEVADALARGERLNMFTTSTALGIRRVALLRLGSSDYELDGKVSSAWSRVEKQYSLVTERFPEADDSYSAIMSRSHRFDLSR
ncbi:aminotransferase class IV [Amycolatopsis cihanbeyliensis]|uniref:Branched-chain-amino-acid aminotransferase n=1 Tax=Amycolatopsis cihanbeyliensis TaxID=1128664 RepID=A0A542DF06_AMYCI|nr:aminotransferase class IV [Amycolatopsis cihanbeyliensis]TQJ01652.1 branched-chain amino acid aminotransferase [Amycolatopsis cihanbeyliensis]